MKKVMFGFFVSFFAYVNVFAEDRYEMARIDLSDTDYKPIILEESFCLVGKDYECDDKNCNLYFINDKNEIEKKNKSGEKEIISSFYRDYLDKKKNEDGSYDLYSCTNASHTCALISDVIDVSSLYISDDKDDYAYYYDEKSSTNSYGIDRWKIYYFLVVNKDNKVAIYDATGKQYLDFGDYSIMAKTYFWDDSGYDSLEKILLKNNIDQSYIFVGADQKIVTLTKEMADTVGINDENILTVETHLGSYYSFIQNDKTKFFTLDKGLINDKEFGESYISYYNNDLVIEESGTYKNLYKLDGTPILSEGVYTNLFYFNDRPEIILSKTDNKVLEIFDGSNIIYTKEIGKKFTVSEALIDSEKTIWIDATEEGEFFAAYVLRTKKVETPKYECKEVDGKYYSKDGSVVDKKTYESVCGLTNNPHTGYVIPSVGILSILGIYVYIKSKKNKIRQI